MNRRILHLAFLGLAAFGASNASAAVESEPNNTNGTANVLAVPFTTNGTGVTVTGKLRTGNVTPDPRDRDQFKFTNTHQFTSFRVKITPSGIDGSQSIAYSILDGDFLELFSGQISSNFIEHTFPATDGANFTIVVDDPGNLTSASGEGGYSIEIVGSPPVSILETEPNNTSATADNLLVPFTTNDTGTTVEGELRENNETPNPRDQDFFRFTNPHQFTSIRVKITPSGIAGSESIAYQILNASQSELFSGNFSSGFRENTISSPAPRAVFFVRVFDPGNLSSESANADYSVEIVGVGGQDPGVLFTNKQAEVFAKQAEVNARNAEILAKQADIATRQGWIASLNSAIRGTNTNLTKQKSLLKRAKTAKAKASIKGLITKLTKQLNSSKSTLTTRTAELAQHNLDLSGLQDRLSNLQSELSVLQEELAELLALI